MTEFMLAFELNWAILIIFDVILLREKNTIKWNQISQHTFKQSEIASVTLFCETFFFAFFPFLFQVESSLLSGSSSPVRQCLVSGMERRFFLLCNVRRTCEFALILSLTARLYDLYSLLSVCDFCTRCGHLIRLLPQDKRWITLFEQKSTHLKSNMISSRCVVDVFRMRTILSFHVLEEQSAAFSCHFFPNKIT